MSFIKLICCSDFHICQNMIDTVSFVSRYPAVILPLICSTGILSDEAADCALRNMYGQSVQRIECDPTNDQPEHQQYQHRRTEHCKQHSHMVDGEQYRTKNAGKLHIHIFFRRDESEAAEEEFFRERIHDGNIDRNPDKVVCRAAYSGGQAGGHTAKINDSAQSKISAEDHTKIAIPSKSETSIPFILLAILLSPIQ